MNKMCFGVFATILSRCKIPSTTQKALVGYILLSVNPSYDITEDDVAVSALVRGKNNIAVNYLGLSTESFEIVSKLQKELRTLTRRRNQLKSKLEIVQSGNHDFINRPVADDFEELAEFFPQVNIRQLSEIENFHKQLHSILQAEIDDEVSRLQPLIASCDKEIDRITHRLEDSGIASDVMQRVLSQGVSISRKIEKMEAKNRDLAHERELQEQRVSAERQLEKLIAERNAALEATVTLINDQLEELNRTVTAAKELPPVLEISKQREISFKTKGDTSEGTAFKSMVLYDLALLALTKLPALIHDSNILHSISQDHFQLILKVYQQSEKQIFIAVDKESSAILTDSAVLELSEGNELFGFSWSRAKG